MTSRNLGNPDAEEGVDTRPHAKPERTDPLRGKVIATASRETLARRPRIVRGTGPTSGWDTEKEPGE